MKRRNFLFIILGITAQIPISAMAAIKKPTPTPKGKATKKPTPSPTSKSPTPSPTSKSPTPSPIAKTSAAPALDEFPVTVDGRVLLLSNISAPTSLYATVKKNGRDYPLLVAKPTDRTLKVFTARCPHQGNILNLASGNEFQCDLHGARFNESTGKVLDGPTINSLDAYEVVDRNGALYIKF